MTRRATLARRPQIEQRTTRPATPALRTLQDAGIAPKLIVAPLGDAAEREADRVAEAVARAGEARSAWSAARPSNPRLGAPVPPGVDRVLRASRGRPLEAPVRTEMENAFHSDFGGVRVHTDPEASRSAREIGARAYTHASDIVFAAGQYAPGTADGRRLLAHELAHVERARHQESSLVRRAPEVAKQPTGAQPYAAFLASPPIAIVSATLSGLTFSLAKGAKVVPGPVRPQLVAVIARALAGRAYSQALFDAVSQAIAIPITKFINLPGGGDENSILAAETPLDRVTLDARSSWKALGALREKQVEPALAPEQWGILARAMQVASLVEEMGGEEFASLNELPAWYTRAILDRRLASRVSLLEDYAKGLDPFEYRPVTNAFRSTQVAAIVAALKAEAETLEWIRLDTSLVVPPVGKRVPERYNVAAAMYDRIFAMAKTNGTGVVAVPTKLKSVELAESFIGWSHSQQALVDRAKDDHETRVELLFRFNFFDRRVEVKAGDERLTSVPTTVNTAPFRSTLKASPEIHPPLYQTATGIDRKFVMKLQYQPDRPFDQFALYSFSWHRIPVKLSEELGKPEPIESIAPAPTPALKAPPSSIDETRTATAAAEISKDPKAIDKLEGGEIANTALLRSRFKQAVAYHRADMETIVREMGPAGSGAADLATINALVRYVGVGVGSIWDELASRQASNWSAKSIPFEKSGLYVVRCVGLPLLSGDEDLVRAPSVAYTPVLARPGDEIAAAATYATRQRINDQRAMEEGLLSVLARADEAEADLVSDERTLSPEERAFVRKMLGRLRADLENPSVAIGLKLKSVRADLETQRKKKPAPDAGMIRALETEEKRLAVLEVIATKRGLASAKPLNVTMLTDSGLTIPLDIEYTAQQIGDTYTVTVSDLTGPNSGTETVTKSTERVALLSAIGKILASGAGYGRGIAAIELGGEIVNLRIEQSVSEMSMEALETLTTVLSIAAIAAAPFTGGATLTLLIPIGVVGAIPSVYRIVTRLEAGTLRWNDPDVLMDVFNIFGSIVGVAQATAAARIASLTAKAVGPGKWLVRTGRGLMFLNIGVDVGGAFLMGGQIVMQLDALSDLPIEERGWRLMVILGNAFVQAGIAGGGILVAKGLEAQNLKRIRDFEQLAARPEQLGKAPPPDVPVADKSKVEDVATKSEPELKAPPLADATVVTEDVTGAAKVAPPDTAAQLNKPSAKPTVVPSKKKQKTASPDAALNKLAERDAPNPTLEKLHRDLPDVPDMQFEWASKIDTWDTAYGRYREARAAAPGRDVAIWHGPDGKFAVTIAAPNRRVEPPSTGGPWRGVVRYQPNPADARHLRLPSPDDFRELMTQAGKNQPARAFIDWDSPDGRPARTEFGVNPNGKPPFYVTIRIGKKAKAKTMTYDSLIAFAKDFDLLDLYASKAKAEIPPLTDGLIDALTVKTKKPKAPKADPVIPEYEPLLNHDGSELTDAGVRWLQENTESGRYKDAATLRREFQQHGSPLEKVFLEELTRHYEEITAARPKRFLVKHSEMKRVLTDIARVVKKQKTEHKISTAVLDERIHEFVANDKDLTALKDRIEADKDPNVRRAWRDFWLGDQNQVNVNPTSVFYLSDISKLKPDAVEVNLEVSQVQVLDITHRFAADVHNFKTLFYAKVIEKATGMKVTPIDVRDVRRMKTIGVEE